MNLTFNLLGLTIHQVYGERPSTAACNMNDLINRHVNAYVVSFRNNVSSTLLYFAPDDHFLDFLSSIIHIDDRNEQIDKLTKDFEDLYNTHVSAHAGKPGKTPSYIILLPRLDDVNIALPFFNTVRETLLKSKLQHEFNDAPSFNAVFIGDYLTLEQMSQETGTYSYLGKELAPEIWFFDGVSQPDAAIQWLTGGDCEWTEYFGKYRPAGMNRQQGIRQTAHSLAAEMLAANSPYSLDRRLRTLIGLKSEDDKDKTALLQRMYAEMCAVLPGAYDAQDDMADYYWYERQQRARWRPYPLLPRAVQALLMGGLLRFEMSVENTQLRLTSPLLAYAVSQWGRSNHLWLAGSAPCKAALEKPLECLVSAQPSGLDDYLNYLLNKAAGKDDGERDHWAVAHLGGISSDGQWWERLPE